MYKANSFSNHNKYQQVISGNDAASLWLPTSKTVNESQVPQGYLEQTVGLQTQIAA